MPSPFGLIGPSYTSQLKSASAQLDMNCYLERVEVEGGKAKWILLNTPGLTVWTNILTAGGAGKGRGIYTEPSTGRSFAVVGSDLWEILPFGEAPVKRSSVAMANDDEPASFSSNVLQLAIASGGTLYVLTLVTNVFAAVSVNGASVVKVGYSTGFGIALYADSNEYAISAPLDFTSWNGTQVAGVSDFSDLVLDMVIDHKEIWLLGQTKAEPWYNDGGALFPYDVVPGGFVDQGSASIWGSAQLDNTFFWVGGDTRGTGIVWRMNGYTPQRVSNHAVENDLRKYQTRNDAIAYGYQEAGHSFYRIVFPSAGTCWCYDVASNQWHQRASFNPATGKFGLPLGQFHTYNDSFNAHLVLDPNGIVYQSSIDFQDDAGVPIRHVRRSAYVSSAGKYLFPKSLEIETNMGEAPQPPLLDGQGKARGAQFMVRWSKDGANKFTDERMVSLGQAGEFATRARIQQLGRFWGTKGLVFEVAWTDPGIRGIVEANLEFH